MTLTELEKAIADALALPTQIQRDMALSKIKGRVDAECNEHLELAPVAPWTIRVSGRRAGKRSALDALEAERRKVEAEKT